MDGAIPPKLFPAKPLRERCIQVHLPLRTSTILPSTSLITAAALNAYRLTTHHIRRRLVRITNDLVRHALTHDRRTNVGIRPINLIIARTLINRCLRNKHEYTGQHSTANQRRGRVTANDDRYHNKRRIITKTTRRIRTVLNNLTNMQ